MNILIAHNHYGRYTVGGEAFVVRNEKSLLEKHNHTVRLFEKTNADVYEDSSIVRKIKKFSSIRWSEQSYREMCAYLDNNPDIDILHVHNYWFVLTPSIFKAAKERGIRTFLTLHNYRLLCPGNQLSLDGQPCEKCLLDDRSWRSLYYRCYPGKSLAKTYLSWRLYSFTKLHHFFQDYIDGYICLTGFIRQKCLSQGMPKNKLHVLPNFITDPLGETGITTDKGYALYLGRLSPEKGADMLISAWKSVDYPLLIVGDGPMKQELMDKAEGNVTFAGAKEHDEAMEILRDASFVMFPSLCYEGFPLSVLEAMACGKAVIATDLGPRKEILTHNETGLLYDPASISDLRSQIRRLIDDISLRERLGAHARQEYLSNYTADRHYKGLLEIYTSTGDTGTQSEIS